MNLRAIRDDTPALSDAELQKRGNDLASQAKRAAIDAVRESMVSEFLARGQSLTVPALRRWRDRATRARKAWEKAEALTDELIREVEKNRAAKRAAKQEGTTDA